AEGIQHCLVAWDVEQARPRRYLEGHSGAVLSLTAAGDDRLASGSADDTVRVWDVATGEEILRLREKESTPVALAFHTDGKALAIARDDHSFELWDTATGSRPSWMLLPIHRSPVHRVILSADGKSVSSWSKTEGLHWDVATGKLLGPAEAPPKKEPA